MQVTFTKEAIEQITPKLEANKNRVLKLKYDTEGCGCVMSGVTVLWLVKEPEEDDVKLETNAVPLFVEKTKMVFLEEQITISFNQSANCFMLKSPSQILNPRMSLLVK
ncbi:iron-sulfur cluster biosynthesis family protein [Metabacillus sediminilitoris]|uniref:Iron-sulfur cluster biosynthesis family protein n=1 Tax=Metabacillus sediminilitoris TaxID=2567941 RepID=A0A4S4C465_9BACI|nr:iron-sulfur cluster biosynthesis family protein [Metabacillus sediminilitoris]QGQ47116.1 iron-sulfur cluster biosynthesis family protein [Metabacillus sediminilitoris]THF80461.1 iron-sulfur cluster biosynthesis family protein [Metabacillus sediminilitoris]